MDYNDETHYLMLSGIQHFQFCQRQWALIHIENQWEENVKTVEGQYVHRIADQPFKREKRINKLIVRAMPIKSKSLRISGICDVVEFVEDLNGVELFGEEGRFLPYPIEYKRGKPKTHDSDILQLTAQAICLEEMLLCDVKTGYLFYNEIKQRVEIPITTERKEKVKLVVSEMHDYYTRKYTPKVKPGKHCRSCSLQNICLPELMNRQSVQQYIEGMLKE